MLIPSCLQQGGAVASELLKTRDKYIVRAVTRNKGGVKAKKLEETEATLVQADLNDLDSLQRAVNGANIIFGVTDFIGAGRIATEMQQGINMLDAALTTLDTLEAFIWSSLPDPRTLEIPYKHVIHFNSKNDIAERMRASLLGRVLIEVQNFVKAPEVYGP